MPERTRTAGALLALALIALVALGPAAPAGADPARPTDYRSTVLRAHPRLPQGVRARAVGGDAFLELQVAGGHRVVVPDYEGGEADAAAPYLRFLPDGTVERNRNAVATAANQSRYGSTTRSPDPTATPSWERVATDGRYAWHDHRIHWMAPRPPQVAQGGRVDLGGPAGTWEVALVVDGRRTTLVGELVRVPPPSPVGWILLALASAAIVLAVVAVRPRGTRAVGATATAAAAGALVAAWAAWSSVPAGAGAGPAGLVVTAAGLAAAIVALAGSARLRVAAWAGTAAALLGWAVLRRAVLTHAVLPTAAPAWFDRAATALALGVGAAIAVAVVWRPPPTGAGRTPSTPELGGESPPLGG